MTGTYTAVIVVGTNIVLLWLAQIIGIPTPSAIEYIQGCMTGAFGALCWQGTKIGALRNDARSKGVKDSDLPRADFYSVFLSLGAAPLGCSALIWAIHLWKGTADNLLLSSGLFLGGGALSTEIIPPLMYWLIPTLLAWLKSLITRALGVLSALVGGVKP